MPLGAAKSDAVSLESTTASQFHSSEVVYLDNDGLSSDATSSDIRVGSRVGTRKMVSSDGEYEERRPYAHVSFAFMLVVDDSVLT